MIKNSNYTIIISPHIDDAIFSLGGLIYEWAQNSQIQIINIFSISNFANNNIGEKNSITSIRKKEDEVIKDLLSIDIVNLDYSEATLRGYKLNNLFLNQNQIPILISKESELIDNISKDLRSYIKSDAIIIAPCSFGGHVDHILARESILNIIHKFKYYYPDLPYASRSQKNKIAYEFLTNKEVHNIKTTTLNLEKHLEFLQIYKSQLKDHHIEEIQNYLKNKSYNLWS